VTNLVAVLYIIAFGMFIYGLMGLTGPKTAVRGNWIAAAGMARERIAASCTGARATATARRAVGRMVRLPIHPGGAWTWQPTSHAETFPWSGTRAPR